MNDPRNDPQRKGNTSEQYWAQVTHTLAQDGPAAIPEGLAARAAAAALNAPRTMSLTETFFALLRPATGLGLACASLLVVISLVRDQPTTPNTTSTLAASDTDTSLYAAVVGGQQDDTSLAGKLLAPSLETP